MYSTLHPNGDRTGTCVLEHVCVLEHMYCTVQTASTNYGLIFNDSGTPFVTSRLTLTA